MLRLSDMARLRRKVRQDSVENLGQSTSTQIVAAIDEGRLEEARALAKYTAVEAKPLHDLFCDWVWDLLTRIAQLLGEQAMYQVLRGSQEGWMMRRTWSAFLKLTVEERVALIAEMMRSHQCGPAQDGGIEVVDEGDRLLVRMDPCGSGGRMRRGDPVNGTPSRLGPPYSFGITREPHDWSWGKRGVPYYCVHCAVNEKLMLEWGGHPLWVTEYDADPSRPCAWAIYRHPDLIPESYYQRLGHQKPESGQGSY